MKGQIHFTNGQILDYDDVEVQYTDSGIVTIGKYEKVFIPFGNIQFVREFL